jgi:hypothetical protein
MIVGKRRKKSSIIIKSQNKFFVAPVESLFALSEPTTTKNKKAVLPTMAELETGKGRYASTIISRENKDIAYLQIVEGKTMVSVSNNY